jgi:hypothetical protein
MGKPSVKALRKRLSGRIADDTLRTIRSERDPNAKESVVWGALRLTLF